MLTDFASDSGSPFARMLLKFAGQEGSGAVDMISRLASHAPALADGSELSGFWKVMMSVGGYGEEGSRYAKLMYLGTRFSDLSQYAAMAKALSGVAGLSAATSGVTGIAATVANGLELDWGSWSGSLNIPSLHNWYTRDLELPTGAPAGG